MVITDNHIEYITRNLELYGIKSNELKEDLLDHICVYIENSDTNDFEKSYQEALQKFGGYSSFQNLQLETNFQKFVSQSIVLKQILYIAGVLSCLLIAMGLLFKLMHWPFASICLLIGFVVLILIFIPVFFYDRYKTTTQKLN